ncbi:hypothetical protein [Leptolyngbya sp. FACHB-17]|uniref:hypothetical protein n=1 Tax=unclassified Leptolyngbya TaxID=2650499 RepID=UPI0016816693|nr:hypothetical protein [Leptolyngbya sp. FACHB-17]MBD2078786.1 hypothetical protein [Leptolyngbya sp. FACHB-17]
MESGDSKAESARQLSNLEEGDIVVLTLDPGFHTEQPKLGSLNRPAVERTARITLKLANSFTVENRRFSTSSGKEMMNVGNGWRIDADSKAFISVPTPEQLERLPDPDGNYTEAQIRRRNEKTVAEILEEIKQYLDVDSNELRERVRNIKYFLKDDTQKEITREINSDVISEFADENRDLKKRLAQLVPLIEDALKVAVYHGVKTGVIK